MAKVKIERDKKVGDGQKTMAEITKDSDDKELQAEVRRGFLEGTDEYVRSLLHWGVNKQRQGP